MTYDLGSQTVDGHAPTPSGALGQAVGGRWNTNGGLIPNHEGMHILVLVKDVGSITEFTYVITNDSDGRHFLSYGWDTRGEVAVSLGGRVAEPWLRNHN